MRLFGKQEPEITLEDQQSGLIEWVSNEDMHPKQRREIMRLISKMNKALTGKEYDAFLKKLALLKLGIGITEEEELEIYRLWNSLQEAKSKMLDGGSKLEYTAALKAYKNFVEELKNEDTFSPLES